MAKPRTITRDEAKAKRFEANELFTPSTPITIAELFAGRHLQINKMLDAIGERGRHIVLFGERGVGKSSIAQIVPFLIPKGPRQVRNIRVQAFPGDTFSIIAKRIFSKIHFKADYGQGEKAYSVGEFYPNDVAIDDFLNEMQNFRESEIPIIVIDEFNEITDPTMTVIIANIIKALSDTASNVTMVIVGVADNITQLFEEHRSIERCTEQIQMPRMTVDERKDILDKRISRLGMSIEGDAKWKTINLSKGLPTYVHHLGKHAVFCALQNLRTNVIEHDVDSAIEEVLKAAQQTLKDSYEAATRSNQARALFRHLITACALAKVDDAGYFMPTAIKDPYSAILDKKIEIANFQDTLREFAENRGRILERTGEQRSFRFRFANPAMQPYVIMRGIADGIIDSAAKRALSSPEQGDLFSSELQLPS